MHSPLEQFVIKPMFHINVANVDISFTQSSLWMMGGIAFATFFLIALRGKNTVPTRWQNIPELFYELVYGMVASQIGDKASKYVPFIFTVLMTVLMGNFLGLLPYSFTYTSHIIVTASLATICLTIVTLIGIVLHGWHFFSLFLPKGVPMFMAPLMIMIEVISYLSRIISLSVRLFANMVAGHTMLKVFALFSTMFGIGIGIAPMLINVCFYALELLVALVQAYIFTMLTCIYLRDAVELH